MKKCNDIKLIQKLPIKPETLLIELFASYSVTDPHYEVPPRYINMQMNIEAGTLIYRVLGATRKSYKEKERQDLCFQINHYPLIFSGTQFKV